MESSDTATEGHEVDKALRIALIGLLFEPIQFFAWWLLWRAARDGKLTGWKRAKAALVLILTIPAVFLTYVIVHFFLSDEWLSLWELLQRQFLVGK